MYFTYCINFEFHMYPTYNMYCIILSARHNKYDALIKLFDVANIISGYIILFIIILAVKL